MRPFGCFVSSLTESLRLRAKRWNVKVYDDDNDDRQRTIVKLESYTRAFTTNALNSYKKPNKYFFKIRHQQQKKTKQKENSSSQTMGLNPQAFSSVMKERIDENHPWVTDDEENTEEIKQIENKLSKHLLKLAKEWKNLITMMKFDQIY